MLLLQTAVMETRTTQVRFVERVFHLRLLGLGLGAFVVGSVFYENGAHPLLWALLALDGFVWPHVARQLALQSGDPERAEIGNLMIDSAMGGLWIALMRFNLLPSALLLVMLAMDKISVGGWRLLGRAFVLQAAACLAGAAATSFAFEPETSTLVTVLSLPFLLCYPVAVSTATFALARAVRRQNRILARQSRVDASTGLLNRPNWEEAVDLEFRRFQRSGTPASLMMIDIDRFKEINDGHGHLVGDEMIRATADIIGRCLRDIDTPGRYGGDEFGVVLAHTGTHAAMIAAERIRRRVAELRLPGAPDLRCTLSIGIASVSGDMGDVYAWISKADAALYRAKTEGRDRAARA